VRDGKIFAAEFVGTFLLTFVGAGAILQDAALGEAGYGLLGIALAHGIALSIAVSATMNISGAHINPAVTLALVATGKCRPGLAPGYVVSQVLGSLVAALVLKAVFAPEIVAAAGLGTPAPAAGVSLGKVILVETALTFVLAVSIWGTAIDRRAAPIGGFGIGLAVFADILVGGPITGAAMNPARVLGPAIAGGVWSAHAAYWIGPVVGATLGSFFWKTLVADEA